MTLSPLHPKAEYNCTEAELYKVCIIGWGSYQENLAGFTAFNTTYTLAFGQTAIAAVNAAQLLPSFQQRGELHEKLLIRLNIAADECLKQWKFLEGHIKRSFPENELKPSLEAAGSSHYSKAGDDNWEYVSLLMTEGGEFINNNTAQLTSGGMPPAFPTDFTTAQTNFEILYQPFKDAQQDAHEQRDNKIIANNAIYNTLTAMFDDGKKVYRMIPAKKERFTFARVLNLVSSGTGGGGTPPPPPVSVAIVVALDMSTPKQATFDFKGAATKAININWGDGNDTDVTFDGSVQNITHNYAAGMFTSRITKDLPDISEMRMINTNLTAVNIPKEANLKAFTANDNPFLASFGLLPEHTKMQFLFLHNCGLDQVSVNNILIHLNDMGLTNGQVLLQGGTNQPPSGQGIAAMNALIAKGWTVTTN